MSNKALTEWGLSEFDFIEALFRYGHFFSPEALEVSLVQEPDLPVLRLTDAVVIAAIRSYQQFFQPRLDEFTMRPMMFGGHERPSIADGEVGESTVMLLTDPRCGMPDFPHPAAAGEQANWPDACRQELTTSYRMTLPGVSDIQLQQLWIKSSGEIEKAIVCKFTLDLAAYPNTRLWAFAANLGGSVLADQYLAQNNCGVRLQGRFSTRQWTQALLAATMVHERLHFVGLNHSNDPNATMFPSIHAASMARWGALVESDIAAAVALGYKKQTATPPVPPTPTETMLVCGNPNGLKDGKMYKLIEST